MKRFWAVTLILLGASSFLNAHEPPKHTSKRNQTISGGSTTKKTTKRTTRTRRRIPAKTRTRAAKPNQPTPNAIPWEKFRSSDGRFSVLIPEIPTDKTETTDSTHGPYTTHLFIAKDTTSVYLIGWVDYDASFNFNRQAELEANRDEFIKGMGARLLSTRPTMIDGYSAIEFTAETDDRIFKSRVYMVGRRPYQIVIGSPKEMDDSANVKRFFNSFKVSLP